MNVGKVNGRKKKEAWKGGRKKKEAWKEGKGEDERKEGRWKDGRR